MNVSVLALAPLSPALDAALAAACDRAGVPCIRWTEGALPETASLIVAELARGERRIPSRALSAAQAGARPILLLCDEPLRSPVIWLQEGRVALMGPPLSPANIACRMRLLLTGMVPAVRGGGVLASARLSRHWWVATSRAEGSEQHAVALRHEAHEGLSALLTLTEDSPVPEADLERAAGILAGSDTDAAIDQALNQLLSDSAGLLRLSADAREWLIYWPAAAGTLCIASPMRLPAFYDVGSALAAAGRRFLRIGAASGDLAAAFAGGGVAPSPERIAHLRSAMGEGGPSVLDLAAAWSAELPLRALVTEVR